MTLYQIKGFVVLSGREIHEEIEADNPRQALQVVLRKHGRLRRGFNIYTKSFLEIEDYPKETPLQPIIPILEDEEVFTIAEGIRSGTASNEEYRKFNSYFSYMVKSAVNLLWNDINDITASEIETEMIMTIATEFLPRVDSRGTFRRFIKMNVQSRIIKLWGRKKYVNGDKTRLRSQLLIESVLTNSVPKEIRNPEELRKNIILMGLKIIEDGRILDRGEKKDFYGIIVDIGMHKECLKSKHQINALQNCYGKNAITELEYGTKQGRTQQNIHTTKRRGEENILKYINKNMRNF